MSKLYFVICILLLSHAIGMSQTKINQYEYWFDNNYASKTTSNITPVSNFTLNAAIPTTALNVGLHIIHVRFKDDNNKYSSVLSQFFVKASTNTLTAIKLTKYEYWFDTNYTSKVTTNFSGSNQSENPISNISTTPLNTGLHTIHFRFQDSNGKWSSTLSQFFYKEINISGTASLLTKYEYWFDTNYASKSSAAFSGSNANELVNSAFTTNALTTGLHILHIRFVDNHGKWSSTLSQFFYKQNTITGSATSLTAYEYWYDTNYGGKFNQNFSGTNANENVISNFSTSTISDGLHVMHIRFRDNNGKWSSTLSQFFYKQNNTSGSPTLLTEYEYWYDTNYINKQVVNFTGTQMLENPNSPLTTASVNPGLHVIHLRFKDNHGKWSSTVSQFFYKQAPAASSVPNKLVAYRYWMDENTATLVSGNITPTVAHHNYLDNLDLTRIRKGKHTIHFQFKDERNMWSSVTFDTITKISLPIAEFSVNKTQVCVNEIVNFESSSIDADEHHWDFQNGNTSTDSITTTSFPNAGTYTVSLMVKDTITLQDSIITKTIVVSSYPVNTLNVSNDIDLCQGANTTLTALASNATYLWSNGETNQSIVVNAQNAYSVAISNVSNPSCTVNSNTIQVNVRPMPIVNLGPDKTACEGINVSLNAFNTNCTYLWNTGNTNAIQSALSTGEYRVVVTSQYNCITKDTIHITIDPLPIPNYSYVVTNQTVQFTNTSNFSNQYSWEFGDGSNANTQHTNHIYANAGGTFTVKLICTNNCGSKFITKNITILPNKISEYSSAKNEVLIFPNPTNGQIFIDIQLLQNSELQVNLLDYTGKQIDTIINEKREMGLHHLWYDTQIHANGLYFIEIKSEGEVLRKKIIVAK